MKKKDENRFWGVNSEQYLDCISWLYKGLSSTDISDSFPVWEKSFLDIHGDLDSQRKIDLNGLSEEYGICVIDREDLFKFLFCLETYYSVVLRIIIAKTLSASEPTVTDIFCDSFYKSNGIENYDCPQYYNWLCRLPLFENKVASLICSPLVPEGFIGEDPISKIFESVFPKEVRHSLGEFYTPYWLADYVINSVTEGDEDASNKSFIDPTCGSGTFIIALINKYKTISEGRIFKQVCGIDINPLTVLAAKTNYLLLYLKEYKNTIHKPVVIPIYYSDIIQEGNHFYDSLFSEQAQYESVPPVKYDYVVGNPPWVNWEYLPDTYKQKYSYLWQHYGLFERKGLNANFIKEDISVLLTYVAIDKYLIVNGKIAFLVKETLFKSIKQGEGFRKFRIVPDNCPLRVFRVEDLSATNPFKDAVTRTAIFYAEKGASTQYPVDYIVWKPKDKKSIRQNAIVKVSECFDFMRLIGRPSEKNVINSGWITESEDKHYNSDLILGTNNYTARTGTFTGGANGVFWLEVLSETDNTVRVRNITARAKNKVKVVTREVEKEFVFPFLTGNELGFWEYRYSKYIICPHTPETKMYPVSHETLRRFPLTESYFVDFREELEGRKGFTSMDEEIHKEFYYTLQRIGDYSFAPYKVCWRYIAKSFTPAVVEYCNDPYLGMKNIIGNEKVIFIGLNDKSEAYYLCGIISSSFYRETIESYMVGTQITPSIINKLNIPSFDPNNKLHHLISDTCFLGHQNKEKREECVRQIDEYVKYLIGL